VQEKRAGNERKRSVSPLTGAPTPAGRPPGVRNKLTNLRDAVLIAFEQVGGVQYLAELARGTQSDRAAFCGLVAKVLPTQINQTVDGGIRLELGWLGGRAIGTGAAQNQAPQVQVVDLQRDERGKYQIVDPQAADPAAATPESPTRSEPAGGSETPAG
jgi:hypothetical protein